MDKGCSLGGCEAEASVAGPDCPRLLIRGGLGHRRALQAFCPCSRARYSHPLHPKAPEPYSRKGVDGSVRCDKEPVSVPKWAVFYGPHMHS
jgi:hypothetical protein